MGAVSSFDELFNAPIKKDVKRFKENPPENQEEELVIGDNILNEFLDESSPTEGALPEIPSNLTNESEEISDSENFTNLFFSETLSAVDLPLQPEKAPESLPSIVDEIEVSEREIEPPLPLLTEGESQNPEPSWNEEADVENVEEDLQNDLEDFGSTDLIETENVSGLIEVDEWEAEDENVFEEVYDEDNHEAIAAQQFRIDKVLSAAIDADASDVHLYAYDEVIFRILGRQERQPQFGVITPEIGDFLISKVVSYRERDRLTVERTLDTSYTLRYGKHSGRRTRLNVSFEGDRYFFVFRIIADQIKTIEELGIPQQLADWAELKRGLVLMNGPTGAGKSTTLASIVQHILNTRPHHVITLEKPVEALFSPALGTVVQRNIGTDARTFNEGLTAAVRGDPDIIMVGEVRNAVELNALLESAETGHLAISTMHTNSTSGVIDRVLKMFDGNELRFALGVLGSVSRGFANQLLLPTVDGTARIAIRELLAINETVKELISDGNSKGVYRYQWDLKSTMEHELIKAVAAGAVTLEAARNESNNLEGFNQLASDLPRFL